MQVIVVDVEERLMERASRDAQRGRRVKIVLGDGCGLYDVDGAVGWVGRGMMECGMGVCLVRQRCGG